MDRALILDVERSFRGGLTVRAKAELPLDDGPVTVLFGPSGSGKSTVLRALAGLEPEARGVIRLGGEAWLDSARGLSVSPQRRRVGFLFQEYALFPHLSVAGNVGYGLYALPRGEREELVRRVADRLRIGDLLDRRPAQLSGGQRQRVALARALAPSPRLLLLDEPLSALDAPTREELRAELRRSLESSGVPAIVVTHDRVEALALGDRMAVMIEGEVRQVGPVREVFSAPAELAVARVVGTENVLAVRLAGRADGLATVRAGEVELVGDRSGRARGGRLRLHPGRGGGAGGGAGRPQLGAKPAAGRRHRAQRRGAAGPRPARLRDPARRARDAPERRRDGARAGQEGGGAREGAGGAARRKVR